MKKATPASAPPRNPDEYLASLAEPARTTLAKLCAAIRSVVPPETTEGMSYGLPAFLYKGSLVCFGAFSDHCSLFPMSAALVEAYKKELQRFDTAKGTIRFPLDKPLPTTLVKKIVKARVAQNALKKQRSLRS